MTIDHTAFPHIVTRILASSSHPVLLAFRQTSKTYKRAVEPFLVHHLVLQNIDGEDTLSSHDGLVKLYPWPGGDALRARAESLIPRARVLDIHTFSRKVHQRLWHRLEELDVVRVFPAANTYPRNMPLPPADTVVFSGSALGCLSRPARRVVVVGDARQQPIRAPAKVSEYVVVVSAGRMGDEAWRYWLHDVFRDIANASVTIEDMIFVDAIPGGDEYFVASMERMMPGCVRSGDRQRRTKESLVSVDEYTTRLSDEERGLLLL